MFDKEFIAKLGRKSVSENTAVAKERVNAIWKSASMKAKRGFFELADVVNNTAYRMRTTGIVTVKLAVAMAQSFNADPYYLIGATDENKGFNIETAKKFLSEHKYAKLVREYERTHKDEDKPAPETPAASSASSAPSAPGSAPASAPTTVSAAATSHAAMQKLTADDMTSLLKGVMIKAAMGQPAAIGTMTKITELLLS